LFLSVSQEKEINNTEIKIILFLNFFMIVKLIFNKFFDNWINIILVIIIFHK